MTFDPDAMSDTIKEELEEAVMFETSGWAHEQVARVSERLQRWRRGRDRKQVHVVWVSRVSALTMPGRHVYLSRHLLEELRGVDDMVAFVVAHELAHHDLGHFDHVEAPGAPADWGRLSGLADAVGEAASWARLGRGALSNVWASQEHERDADRLGFEHCLRAGYDAEACLEVFRVLEARALRWGDVDGVFGVEELAVGLLGALRRGVHGKQRGYDPLRERARLLREGLRR
jgi:predicted Zn-dependent protease